MAVELEGGLRLRLDSKGVNLQHRFEPVEELQVGEGQVLLRPVADQGPGVGGHRVDAAEDLLQQQGRPEGVRPEDAARPGPGSRHPDPQSGVDRPLDPGDGAPHLVGKTRMQARSVDAKQALPLRRPHDVPQLPRPPPGGGRAGAQDPVPRFQGPAHPVSSLRRRGENGDDPHPRVRQPPLRALLPRRMEGSQALHGVDGRQMAGTLGAPQDGDAHLFRHELPLSSDRGEHRRRPGAMGGRQRDLLAEGLKPWRACSPPPSPLPPVCSSAE